ncbi:MAG: STAS/SEC14 domain-containing protein [Bacteroidetes bacterium SW_9_63_38]|nr:MAG: STAS/SEC14 domain-containing protein [Bacteroidetes bacterium SW_9_63_38]
MHELLDLPDTNIIGFRLSNTLTEEDFDTFVSRLHQEMEAHTTTRLVLEINDVDGWEPEETWEELSLDIRYLQDLDKVALIGTDVWEPLMDKIELLFPMSQIQAYDDEDREEALDWIRGDMDVPGIGPGSVSDPQAGAQDGDDE